MGKINSSSINNIGNILLYLISTLGSLFAIFYMQKTIGWYNKTLLILLISILAYSIAQEVYFMYFLVGSQSNLAGDFGIAFELVTHWLITDLYLKSSFRSKQLIQTDLYLNDPQKKEEIEHFNERMLIANVWVYLLIFANLLLWFEAGDGGDIFTIADVSYQIMLWLFLLCWAWTLRKLYQEVVFSKKLLPDSKIFVLHGSLLFSFLVGLLLATLCNPLATAYPNAAGLFYGVANILYLLINWIEMFTFFLVVNLMLPVTRKGRIKQEKLRGYSLNGFFDPNELENAIIAQHPGMPDEVRERIKLDCEWISGLVTRESAAASIVSGMVNVVGNNEYAFMGNGKVWRWTVAKETPDEIILTTHESSEFLIKSLDS